MITLISALAVLSFYLILAIRVVALATGAGA